MQSYALDSSGKRTFVQSAERFKDYFCIECGARVRVRGGQYRVRAHYFHIHDVASCRQAGKTVEHVAIQKLIQEQIGTAFCEEEYRFSSIGRVADVAWPDKKLIFEVQCSPISAKEVEERNRDYASIGWDVIWILYDKTFKRKQPSHAELFLQKHTHYYSDVATIYDTVRYSFIDNRCISVDRLQPMISQTRELPKVLQERLSSWIYCAEGDYLLGQDDAWQAAVDTLFAIEKKHKQKRNYFYPLERVLLAFRALWHVVLERSCRLLFWALIGFDS